MHDQTEGAKYSGFKVVALHAGSLTPNVTTPLQRIAGVRMKLVVANKFVTA